VTPLGTVPNVVIEASLNQAKDGAQMVLLVQNKGTQHQLLKGMVFKAVTVGDKKEYELPAESVAKVVGQNILAGKTRKFAIPWPKNVPTGPVKVTVEVAKK
jgi:fimbrial chaperone protein